MIAGSRSGRCPTHPMLNRSSARRNMMDDERPFPNGGNMRVAIGALLGLLVASPLAAQDFPVQIALFTPIQIVKAEKGVSAIRFNFLYSVNKSVKYVDL